MRLRLGLERKDYGHMSNFSPRSSWFACPYGESHCRKYTAPSLKGVRGACSTTRRRVPKQAHNLRREGREALRQTTDRDLFFLLDDPSMSSSADSTSSLTSLAPVASSALRSGNASSLRRHQIFISLTGSLTISDSLASRGGDALFTAFPNLEESLLFLHSVLALRTNAPSGRLR